MSGWGTPAEIALYVGRPVKTVRNWASAGVVPAACRLSDRLLVVNAEAARRHAERVRTRRRGLRRVA